MRLPVLSSDEMTSEQVDLYREILGGPRGQGPRAVLLASGAGGLAGPFNAMLYAPSVGHALRAEPIKHVRPEPLGQHDERVRTLAWWLRVSPQRACRRRQPP